MQLLPTEIDIIRQWFDAVHDLNPNYLQKADNILYLKILDEYNPPPNQVNTTEAKECILCDDEGMCRSPGGWYKCGK